MPRKEITCVGSSFITCETCNILYEYRSSRKFKGKSRHHCPTCMALPFEKRIEKWKQNQMRIKNLQKSLEQQN